MLRVKLTLARLTALMQSKATTVQQYLAELPADRRAAIAAVRAGHSQEPRPGFIEEGMQYGMIGYYVPHRVYPAGYHCDPRQPLPFAGLASQKNYMSLYLMCVYGDRNERSGFARRGRKTGKKLDMGKSCIRFKKLEDLALDVIGEAIRRSAGPRVHRVLRIGHQNLAPPICRKHQSDAFEGEGKKRNERSVLAKRRQQRTPAIHC